ncbi:MAG: hypothetical protein JWN30_2580 [Bacilli bacterium]|nr:hypothetical protein [Bacilli bacterium]
MPPPASWNLERGMGVKLAAALLIGMVLGAALLTAVRGRDLEHLYVRVAEFQNQISQLEEHNANLTLELQTQKRDSIRRVRSVEVRADAQEDFARLEAVRQASQQCKPLLQMNVDALELHPEIVTNLLEGQLISIDNASYRLHVDQVIIGETLRVHVICQKQAPPRKNGGF